ncbi:MAG: hypothetical protein E7Z91_06490 [Cyanobacteria bacterium SIG30]|nr:hypothetical protein [Cyanobacteria bacterium SIG30]
MFEKKKAFTVAEIVISLFIIGVLTVITLQTTQHLNNNYTKLYSAAYNGLVQAVGNAYLNWDPGEEDNFTNCGLEGGEYRWSKACWKFYTNNMGKGDGGNPITATLGGKTYSSVCFDSNSSDDPNISKCDNQTHELLADGIKGFPRKYPGFLFGRYVGGNFDGVGGSIDPTDQDPIDVAFCKSITKYFNTLNSFNECQSFITGMRDYTDKTTYGDNEKSLDFTKGQNFLNAFCALETTLDPGAGATYNHSDYLSNVKCSGTSGGSIIPSFITANGQKFYISKVLNANMPFFGDPTNPDYTGNQRRYFRFIVVDLNGDARPNRQYVKGGTFPWTKGANDSDEVDSGSYPDLVLFAITDSGYVIPLGIPEFAKNYASATVYFPEYLNECSDSSCTEFKKNDIDFSDAANLFYAKLTAWGVDGIKMPNMIYGQPVLESEPISWSTYFYWIGLECGKDGCNNKSVSTDLAGSGYKLYADKLMSNLIRQFMFKNKGATINAIQDTIIPSAVSNIKADVIHGCETGAARCKVEIGND